MDTARNPSARRGRGALGLAVALAALGAAAACVKTPDATSCGTGIYCPAGAKCAARQAVCIFDDCGDGVVQPGEACDDGNLVDGDGCSHDCKSTEICGNGIRDVVAGEECDDGNLVDGDGCNSRCRSEVCGNGRRDPGEQCDPGPDFVETTYCNSDCTVSRCGDGKLNRTAGEECDDGNSSNDDDCVKGCKVAWCGDGYVDSDATSARYEECDLGSNTNSNNPDCPYGDVQCERCSLSCKTITPVLHYCGDGKVDWIEARSEFEPCDATTSIQVCKTCRVVDPGRCELVASAGATGTIVVRTPGDIADGDALVIEDGENPPLTIEFDVDGNCTTVDGGAPRRCARARDASGVRSAHEIATDIASAVTRYPAPVHIGASVLGGTSNDTVRLVNSVPGVSGNHAIGRTGELVKGAVTVSGMSGGVGCSFGGSCAQGSDCVSGTCVDGTCW
jgi:cysteine-rich repeat protein